jgi:hypothetical protein
MTEDVISKGSDPVAARQADDSELPAVSIYGDLAGTVTSIPGCMLSLVVRVGTLDDQSKVLVPMTEFQMSLSYIDASDEGQLVAHDDDEDGFAAVIPLENAAFILAEFAADLETVCEELTAFSTARLKPEPKRLDRCAEYLADAKKKIEQCIERLGEVSASGE